MKYSDEPSRNSSGSLTIPAPANIGYGFVSASGKSFVYRTVNRGEPYSSHRFKKFPFPVKEADHKRAYYSERDLIKHDFSQGEETAIVIKYHKI